ncbi:MAG: glucans biosynthesis glucosyltransferase MdoH [Alphaproteobacteria bacterium]|nr:glucans biosynthesis glucosyltransferase MdoH [Alphaproteobacteria bacterium]
MWTAAWSAVLGSDLARDGFAQFDPLILLLFATAFAWISLGFAFGMSGLLAELFERAGEDETPPAPVRTRTVLLFPVYNEAPERVFSTVRSLMDDLARLGARESVDLFVLSDTRDEAIAAEEHTRVAALVSSDGGPARLFYRRRLANAGRKAGNIADFVRRWGGRYDYMIVLDADSVMSARTILKLAAMMEADETTGLIQTVPILVGRTSLFARLLQFASALYSRAYARGFVLIAGTEGTYWGHNAIIRVRAFAECCGLPALRGRAPFGGEILSHDFVEGALLGRGGWRLRLASELEGSFEESPPNLLAYARRDRRWAQGNLQHLRLLRAPGLSAWSRVSFALGALGYLSSLVWLAFFLASLADSALGPGRFVYFTGERQLFPDWSNVLSPWSAAVLIVSSVMIFGPRLLIALKTAVSPRRSDFGGGLTLLASVLFEVLASTLVAPVLMIYQSRAVVEVLLGRDSGWPAAERRDGAIPLVTAANASWWVSLTGLGLLAGGLTLAPAAIWWTLPVSLPMIFAPLVISATASPELGIAARATRLLLTPAETGWSGRTASPASDLAGGERRRA